MFKAQYKSRSPYESWNTLGMYTSEANAISSAMLKKKRGALLVRVVDQRGGVVYVQ
jgi:deoxycytidylate deaminase